MAISHPLVTINRYIPEARRNLKCAHPATWLDRVCGCLYGIAIGDALGMPANERHKGNFSKVIGYRGDHLPAGQWGHGMDCVLSIARALLKGRNGREQVLLNKSVSPLAIASAVILHGSDPRFSEIVTRAVSPLKKHTESHRAAIATSNLLTLLLTGSSKRYALTKAARDIRSGNFNAYGDGDFTPKSGRRNLLETLETALWAFQAEDRFDDAVLAAVNVGANACTTGAICGMFAGAHHGFCGIQGYLLDGLQGKSEIEEVAQRLILAK